MGSICRQQPCWPVGWICRATCNPAGTAGDAGSRCTSRGAAVLTWVPVLLFLQSLFDNKFDDIFGSSLSSDPFNFNSQNGMNKDDK